MGNYLGRASSFAPRKRALKPIHETLAQIDAKRFKSLNKSLVKGTGRATKAHKVTSNLHHSTAKSRGSAAVRRSFDMAYINPGKTHPLDSKYMHYKKNVTLAKPHLMKSGHPKKFVAVVGPGRYLSRASWGQARSEFIFRKVIKPRVHHFKHITKWRKRGHDIVPT